MDTSTFETLELPWQDNLNNISCIPAGEYIVAWTYSPRYKRNMYCVLDVPNRSGIRIHAGNTYKAFLGCIGLGKTRGILGSIPAILNSAYAVREFESLMNQKNFKLTIKWG